MKRKPLSVTTKREVWDKCNGRCWYCGARVIRPFFHFDHVYPHSKGGDDTVGNLVVSCIPCNLSKKNLELWKWRIRIERRLGLAMPKSQIVMLRSEGIDFAENPYSWEPPVLFFFERNIPKEELFGDCQVDQIVRFKGWSE